MIKFLSSNSRFGKLLLTSAFSFLNKLAIKSWQKCTCPLAESFGGWITKINIESSSKFWSYWIIFCVFFLLMCNFQYVLLVDSKDRAVVVYNFFFKFTFSWWWCCGVWFKTKFFWSLIGIILSINSFWTKFLYCSCIWFKKCLRVFENLLLIICFAIHVFFLFVFLI